MLGLSINNEFLDLDTNAQLELEQTNPFLQLADELVGDLSLPVDVKLNDKNLRLLNFAGLLQNKVDQAGIPVSVFDTGTQHSIGKLKIEKPKHDLNRVKDGSISLYYLSAFSNFAQDVKGIKLRSIDFGGDRTFAFSNYNRTGGTGFWQHLHAVVDAAPAIYDYAFYPVEIMLWFFNF